MSGLKKGGDRLADGTYQYNFLFALRPGHLTGLFSGANDVVRLEVADTTTGEILLDRTLQMRGFSSTAGKK